MTDDLPARLLAALDQLEFVAKQAAGYQTGSRLEGQPPAWVAHAGTWTPLSTLELIKAHREIVELHLVCQADAPLAWKRLEDAAATSRREYYKAELEAEAADARLLLSAHIVEVIARGYGIDPDEPFGEAP